jgi:hypothetical protein
MRSVVVYSLSSAMPDRVAGFLARQASDALARMLSAFPEAVARTHHMIDPEDALDSTLEEDERDPVQMRFVLMSSLPSGALLRTLTLEQGGQLALTGRLDPSRDRVRLTVNLWSTGSPMSLLWCCVLDVDREQLPLALSQIAARVAWSLELCPSRTQAQEITRQALGTLHGGAWEAWATATDHLRLQALGQAPQKSQDVSVTRALCHALGQDPRFEAARLLLAEQAMSSLRQGDRSVADALLRGLEPLGDRFLIYGLLRMEAHLCLDQVQEARQLLIGLQEAFAGHSALEAASRRLPEA